MPILDRTLIVFSAVALLSSCGNSVERDPVAARVNGKSISFEQLRSGVERARSVPGVEAPTARQVLDALIDQQLLVQKALESQIDGNAAVADALMNTRAQILAQAYVSSRGGVEKPDPFEIRRFYEENPLLFAQRSIYRLVELSLVEPDPSVAAMVERARNPFDLAASLAAQNVRFDIGTVSKAAEELRGELLARLAQLPERQTLIVQTANGVSVMQLLERRDAKLSEVDASERIERLLMSRKFATVAANELAQLRRVARIEYVMELPASVEEARLESPASSAAGGL